MTGINRRFFRHAAFNVYRLNEAKEDDVKHDEIKRKIMAFTDNELKGTDSDEITAHIKLCQECREIIANYQLLIANLKQNRELNPSSSFRARVNAAIDTEKTEKAGWIKINKLIPVPIALAVVVVVFSIYMAAAPVIYGMNNDAAKMSASEMVKNVVMSGITGGVFAPAAFAKFCEACTENACTCKRCEKKCDKDCKMKMGGEKHGR